MIEKERKCLEITLINKIERTKINKTLSIFTFFLIY